MKKLLIIFLVTILNTNIYSQEKLNIPTNFPTEFGKFTFPLGSKIVLELQQTSNEKYEYKVINIEKIEGYYSLEKDENLFVKEPKKNTVELFFMGAYYNDGKDDKDWKSVLILRNNIEKPIIYKADIKYYYKEEFENTSIVGAFPKTKTTEIWAHKIDFITLYDFKNLKNE